MPTAQKEATLKVLSEKFEKMEGVILTGYQGLRVDEVYELRKSLRATDSQYLVVKNTIASLALQKTDLKDMKEEMVGQR